MKIHTLAVFPGTFDPPTLGHFDIISRAAAIFDELVVAVAKSPSKHTFISLEDRTYMLEQTCERQRLTNVRIVGFAGLLVDFLKELDAKILVRGVRTVADFDYEVQLTGMYRAMMPNLEIVMMPTSGHLSYISSSLVREVIIHQGDISPFVPEEVARIISQQYLKK